MYQPFSINIFGFLFGPNFFTTSIYNHIPLMIFVNFEKEKKLHVALNTNCSFSLTRNHSPPSQNS